MIYILCTFAIVAALLIFYSVVLSIKEEINNIEGKRSMKRVRLVEKLREIVNEWYVENLAADEEYLALEDLSPEDIKTIYKYFCDIAVERVYSLKWPKKLEIENVFTSDELTVLRTRPKKKLVQLEFEF